MIEKRGRPKKQVNTLDVNGLITEFITTKTENYKNKMSGILKEVSEGAVMPFWKTEDHEYMLKVKKKYAPKTMLDNGDIVTLNLMFKYYCMEKEDGLIQGYYAKILSYDDDKENN